MRWKCKTYQSKWVRGVSAGGCGQNNQAKFWMNPQFLINLPDVDKDDDENLATVIISLMQKDTRLKRVQTGTDSCEEYIQFRLFKVLNSSILCEFEFLLLLSCSFRQD